MRLALSSLVLLLGLGCEAECPTARSIEVAGDAYCGSSCAACDDCLDGFSCQFRSGRGVCVDDAFLVDRGQSTACVDPCPTGEARYDDMGTSSCVRICNVDGECPFCCFEPASIEYRICAPRAALCP
ncbi:MAG: hypothetical protein H6719_01610 [Sandaracinaceae bacterium]|nr:hypothetical protein [Sandaracinaceae bacterium]